MGPDRIYERLVEGEYMDQAFAEGVTGHLIIIGFIISLCTLAYTRKRKISIHRGSR